MRKRVKKTWEKFVNWSLDFLLFIIPILELSEVVAIIPVEYLPWYMLITVLIRRAVRIVEDKIEDKNDKDTNTN